jgi:hypothetical protein
MTLYYDMTLYNPLFNRLRCTKVKTPYKEAKNKKENKMTPRKDWTWQNVCLTRENRSKQRWLAAVIRRVIWWKLEGKH